MSSSRDEAFMREAIAEAEKGVGRTHPNPPVGAVLVKAGKVVGRGFHPQAGSPHAEVFALREAGVRAKGAEAYVTLQPCNHFGRTPPCTQALLKAGVRRVVVGSMDPSPWITDSVGELRKAGLKVTTGVLRDQTDLLVRPFFKHVREGLPWVTLKVAMSLDGKIAAAPGKPTRISGKASSEAVHRLRDRADVVLVAAGTVRADNPRLTTRLPSGSGRDPVRVILSSDLRLDPKLRILRQRSAAPTIIATSMPETSRRAQTLKQAGAEIWSFGRAGRSGNPGRVRIGAVLQRLGDEGYLHVLVEGGAELNTSFLREGLADELLIFLAPKLCGSQGLSWLGDLKLKAGQEPWGLPAMTLERSGEDVALRVDLTQPEKVGPRRTRKIL